MKILFFHSEKRVICKEKRRTLCASLFNLREIGKGIVSEKSSHLACKATFAKKVEISNFVR